ncbi:unnamed protein product [Fraxinus pennsylvanica]|uniref:BZIP domain-containing protein n=1 Tax=Fraxinus pennsylvanica TaxID=56036 RepID=A0AAD1ZLL0_9LAMI|nr:unnamed protein product [Fraxinus pennsylvanica]
MVPSQEQVQYQPPVLEDVFSNGEIYELFSLFQSEQHPVQTTSSLESTRSVYSIEERKRRRMISNRESARRSRWRKKTHLMNLENEANSVKIENRKLKIRLCRLTNEYHFVQRDTNLLTLECIDLQQRLARLCQILQPFNCTN